MVRMPYLFFATCPSFWGIELVLLSFFLLAAPSKFAFWIDDEADEA